MSCKIEYIPFVGSKRYRVKEVLNIVKNGGYDHIIEPFGGSCVISGNISKQFPSIKCIANDYDGYFDGFEEKLDLKDEIISKCLAFGIEKRSKKLPVEQSNYIKELVKPLTDKQRLFLANNFIFSAKRTGFDGSWKDTVASFNYFHNDITTDNLRRFWSLLKNNVELDKLDYKDFLNKYLSPPRKNFSHS